MMTMEQITDEVKQCSERIREISELLPTIGNSGERIAFIDEMIEIAKRRFELDTMSKKLLLDELRKGLL